MIRRYFHIPALISLMLLSSFSPLFPINYESAKALSGKDFNPGRIIDDSVFYNHTAMTASQIQTFLSSKVPNCDTDGTQPATDWGRSDITHAQLAYYKRTGTGGYAKDTGFHAPPYVCLKNFKQNTPQMENASGLCGALTAKSGRTAAQIIYDIAQACGISPRVLVVLLEKEQSLVTDNWPLNRQYKNATGFACPDTAPCDPAYNGFFYQVYHAARQFKVYKKYPNDYNYIAGRTNHIYWHPSLGSYLNSSGNNDSRAGCGYSNVYIDNQATAALYIYTPYRPNPTALSNLYGGQTDGCSSYGNRNFWRLFADWFGNPTYRIGGPIGDKYQSVGGSTSFLGSPIMNEKCGLINNGCYQKFEGGSIYWTRDTGAQITKGSIRKRWVEMGAERSSLGYPTGPETATADGGWKQSYQNGYIIGKYDTGYWESKGSIRQLWVSLGAEGGSLGYPVGPETAMADGGWQQRYLSGRIVGKYGTGYWVSKGSIRKRWVEMGAERSSLGYPTGPETATADGGWKQSYQNGYIIGKYDTGYWESKGSIRQLWVSLGAEGGSLGYPVGPETAMADGGWKQSYQNGYIIGKYSTGYKATIN